MRILVTSLATLVRDGAPEIAAFVTVLACSLCVFSREWKFRRVVIETCTRNIALPSVGRVAALAGALETGLPEGGAMGIGMAVLARLERQPGKLRFLHTRFWSVAFLACRGLMLPGQREVSAGVAEPLRRLPCFLGVATSALSPQLTAMLVLMTERALLAQPQKRSVQILHLDFSPGSHGNSSLRVATLARLLAMFALQQKPGLSKVVESLAVQTD
ncbi:MAG: hypothetical protein P4L56_17910 [Candidatus Sulfopaludibacter sp.]|nr:hypothetical protein [Candidatus Sulfopaludibacter sp.]